MKCAIRIGIYRKFNILPYSHTPDIGFIYQQFNLHTGQIRNSHDNHLAGQPLRNRFTCLHRFANNCTIHWGKYNRIINISLCLFISGFGIKVIQLGIIHSLE